MKYPEIEIKRLNGEEPIIDASGRSITNVNKFWQWAYSNIFDNAERGALAEYLVASALRIADGVRLNWEDCDLITEEGIKIEVKSSAYIQSWAQEKLSKLTFDIQPTHGWNRQTNKYTDDVKRRSDIYVFCVLKHVEQKSLNPLDISQWDFYILPTRVLNEKAGKQKTVTLSSLLKLGAARCEYEKLSERIIQVL